jgi:hypothetical protein
MVRTRMCQKAFRSRSRYRPETGTKESGQDAKGGGHVELSLNGGPATRGAHGPAEAEYEFCGSSAPPPRAGVCPAWESFFANRTIRTLAV